MTTKHTQTDLNFLKLKMALAAGGFITTLIGAGLLGNQAGAEIAHTTTSVETITTSVITDNDSETAVTDSLNLSLEAIPTVAAPTFGQISVANSRSSG